MTYYVAKIAITSLFIVVISEVAKRSSLVGAILASLPLVSILAMFWLYFDTKDAEKVSALAGGIFWLILPSLALFVSLPWMIKHGYGFYTSISVSVAVTVACYYFMIAVLGYFGVKL